MAPVEVVCPPDDEIRLPGLPSARAVEVARPTPPRRRARVKPSIQVPARRGDGATRTRGGRPARRDPGRGRRLLRSMDGRGEGTHDQLSERGLADGEVPREGGGAPPARDWPEQAALLTIGTFSRSRRRSVEAEAMRPVRPSRRLLGTAPSPWNPPSPGSRHLPP